MLRSKKDFARLRRELAAEFAATQKKGRRQVVDAYARKKNGQVILCTPSQREIDDGFGDDGWGSNGKLIYDSLHIARLAAREFEKLSGRPMRAYECHRSKSGHAHLTSRSHWI